MRAKFPTPLPRVRLDHLPGVSGGSLNGYQIRTVTEGLTVLTGFTRVITHVGDRGGVVIWKDDDGWFHCEFHVKRVTIASGEYKFKYCVKEFLQDYIPACH